MQNPGLGVNGLHIHRIGQKGSLKGRNLRIGNLLRFREIVLVEQFHGSRDAGLEMLFSGAGHVPALQLGFGQEEFHLGAGKQDAGTVRALEFHGQERTDHAGRIVVLVITGSGVLGHQGGQRGNLAVGRGIHPVVVPGGTGVTGMRAAAYAVFPGADLVGHVHIALRRHIVALGVDIVADDTVQTGVIAVFELVEQRGADKGRRLGILPVKDFAKGIHAIVQVAGAVVQGERSVDIPHIGIVGSRVDVAAVGGQSGFEFSLGLVRVHVGDTHGKAHAQGVGILLPLGHVAVEGGNVAGNHVGAGAQLLRAGGQLGEEEIVDVLLAVILGHVDAIRIALAGLGAGNVSVDIGKNGNHVHKVDAQHGVQIGLGSRVGNPVHQVLDAHLVELVPHQTHLVVVGMDGTGIVGHVPAARHVLRKSGDIAAVCVHEAEVAVGLQQRIGQERVGVHGGGLGLIGVQILQISVGAGGNAQQQGQSRYNCE